jgi:adenylate cyclase
MLMSCYRALGDLDGLRRSAQLVADRAEQALAADYANVTSLGNGMGAMAALGLLERSRELMERALLIQPNNMRLRYNMACSLAAHLGDYDSAIEILTPVTAAMSKNDLLFIRRDPDFDNIRDDARFVALLNAAEVRLAQSDEPPPTITW